MAKTQRTRSWSEVGIDESTFSGHGDNRKAKCPVCPEHKNKNQEGDLDLSVNVAERVWNCHRCEFKGSLETWEETDAPLRERPREEPEFHALKPGDPKYRRPQDHIVKFLPPRATEWFADRGISQATLEKAGVGFKQKFSKVQNGQVDVIQFPYFRDGELLNIKFRTFDKKFSLVGGCERLFFGLDQVKGKVVFVVEGEMDVLSLNECGIWNAVSVPDGAPSPGSKNLENKFRFLDADIDRFEHVDKIIIAVDDDEPGRFLGKELARRFGPERCHNVIWPEGCKDANDVLVQHGKSAVIKSLDTASPWPVKGLVSVADIEGDIWDIYENGLERGRSTGWAEVDEIYTVRPGELTVVTGIPSHGKSLVISALTVNLAQQEGWRFSFFSPEHSAQRQTITLMSQYLGLPFRKGAQTRMSKADAAAGLAWVRDHYGFIKIDDDRPTINKLLELARIDVKRRGITGVVIDPWNEIDHSRDRGVTEQEYISHALSSVRLFAEKYQVHVWLIAHPTKMQREKNGDYEGKYPPPSPYDIASSANFRNKATNCLSIWRDSDADSQVVEFHTQKIKFPEIGHHGMSKLMLDKATGTFLGIR